MGSGCVASLPYDPIRREVYRGNGLDANESAALAIANSLNGVDEQVWSIKQMKKNLLTTKDTWSTPLITPL